MLTGTGGNCGSQSSTLVIRGLAVGEIEFSDLFKVIWKEIRIAFCISIILSVVNGIRIMLMGQEMPPWRLPLDLLWHVPY